MPLVFALTGVKNIAKQSFWTPKLDACCCVYVTVLGLVSDLNLKLNIGYWQVLGRAGVKCRHEPKAREYEVIGHGVAVLQRGIGGSVSEGSRPTAAVYCESTEVRCRNRVRQTKKEKKKVRTTHWLALRTRIIDPQF